LNKGNILWVDDEIELLKPHIILLEQKGYNIVTASNGDDAVEILKEGKTGLDLVFLDETMFGMSGLETLPLLKEIDPGLPVVMVTKNEAEGLMEDAIGAKIDDYLTKPVNPAQVLMACKKFIEGNKIESEKTTQKYFQSFNRIHSDIGSNPSWNEWVDIYKNLVKWSIEIDKISDENISEMLRDQWKTANYEFSKTVERNYISWINDEKSDESPALSPHVNDKWLRPILESKEEKGPVFYFVIDCMRYDQWLVIQDQIKHLYTFETDFHCAILPTVTAYCRNSIFSGLYPDDIKKRYPEFWQVEDPSDEHSLNKFEEELLQTWIDRRRIKLKGNYSFLKIFKTSYGQKVEREILNYQKNSLTAIVINAMDMIAHSRSDYSILKEIAPDESAYRSLTESWFKHSSFFGMLRQIAEIPNAKVLITTDHGSVRCLHGVRCYGDKNTSTSLRYKFGKNVKADYKDAMQIQNLTELRLPKNGLSVNNVIAKEDKYLIYPTDHGHYLNKYRDSFQHGGISMEEMIAPVITLKSKVN
jgi:CheY-like chemotaxis protein